MYLGYMSVVRDDLRTYPLVLESLKIETLYAQVFHGLEN